jgi:hypothetical protein
MKIRPLEAEKEVSLSGSYSLRCSDRPCKQPMVAAVVVVAVAPLVAREAKEEETKLLKNSMTIESSAHTVAANLKNWLVRGICLIASNL